MNGIFIVVSWRKPSRSYYKSCTVSEFYPTDKIWLKFTVTVVFFKDFRISSDVILCTEDGTPIYTEDDANAN